MWPEIDVSAAHSTHLQCAAKIEMPIPPMTAKAKNQTLTKARDAKKDEFYTQLSVIEKELKHYRDHFKGKVVYCNCDDPRISNFFHYFSYTFEKLGLKKLITTCLQEPEHGSVQQE